jgi:hypothetical protein
MMTKLPILLAGLALVAGTSCRGPHTNAETSTPDPYGTQRVSENESAGDFKPLVANRISETFAFDAQAPETAGNAIAGNISGWVLKDQPIPVTLAGVDVPAVEVTKAQTAQVNNSHRAVPFKYRKSSEIDDSIAALAIGFGDIISNYTRKTKSYPWGAYFLTDGETSKEENTCFSSKQYFVATPTPAPWVIIRMKKCRRINTVVLQDRKDKTNFPLDFTIQTSRDGKQWETVIAKQAYAPSSQDDGRQRFIFKSVKAKFLKITATRLRPEKKRVYYFQMQEVEIRHNDGPNYALASNGGYATSSGSVKNDNFDYEYFYGSIIDAGVKRVLISFPAKFHFAKFLSGELKRLPDALISNLKYLRENDVKVSFRIKWKREALSRDPVRETREWVEFNRWIAAQIHDYIENWVIGNEVNFTPETQHDYVELVKQTAKAVRSTGYDGLMSINTALFDFTWSEKVLKAGLADVIDTFNVHIYKELPRWADMPEVVGTFMIDGKRHWPGEQPYDDYRAEQAAFKSLLAKYNPAIKIWVTETAVNTGDANPLAKSGLYSGAYFVSELSQAKYLARLYVVNQIFGVGPTFWWTLDPFILRAHWGLIDQHGKRKPAWYALRNYSALFDSSLKLHEKKDFISISGSAPNIFGATFRAQDNSLLVPLWCAVPMNDANRGEAVSISFNAFKADTIEAYDLISGTRQRLNFTNEGDIAILRDFIIRDYPVVLKLTPER